MSSLAPAPEVPAFRVFALAALALLLAAPALAAPPRSIHQLDWKVHVDLIDVGAGRDLAFYAALIQARLEEADVQVQGHQGPFDSGCCVELDAVTVTTFGSALDGLNVIESQAELSSVFANPGNYLVEAVWFCGNTFSMGIRGCAQTPGDRLVVGFESEDNQILAKVAAHEQGHNAGLNHIANNDCELMRAGNGGACLSVSECNAFIADADTTGGSCECLADTLGDAPIAVGTACTPDAGGGGFCGGGVCGASPGVGDTLLSVAGGVGAASGVPPTSLLAQPPASGDWDGTGAFGGMITGLAFDSDAGVLYGIESRPGDDALVTIDQPTGEITSTVGVLNGIEEGIALAFDADDTNGDRLLLIELDDDFFGQDCLTAVGIPGPCFSALFEVDPSNAATTFRGEINFGIVTGGRPGLAWNETNGKLYSAAVSGLREVDEASCSGGTCPSTNLDNRFYDSVALTWDPNTGDLIRVGFNGVSGTEIEYFDVATGQTRAVRGIDQFTAGGLAAGHVPTTLVALPALDPLGALALFAALIGLGVARLRR